MRFEGKRSVRGVQDRDVPARPEQTVVLIDVTAAAARRQVLDHTDREHQVEGAVGERQARRRLVREAQNLPNLGEPQLVHLGANHAGERLVDVERVELGNERLLVQELGDVPEGAADLQHGEIAPALLFEIRDEPLEEEAAARLLEGQIQGGALETLAVDEHSDDPLAVVCPIGTPVDAEDALGARILEREAACHDGDYRPGGARHIS